MVASIYVILSRPDDLRAHTQKHVEGGYNLEYSIQSPRHQTNKIVSNHNISLDPKGGLIRYVHAARGL